MEQQLVAAKMASARLSSLASQRPTTTQNSLDHRFDQYLDGGILYLGFMNLTLRDFKRIVLQLAQSRCVEDQTVVSDDRVAIERHRAAAAAAAAGSSSGSRRPSKRPRRSYARTSSASRNVDDDDAAYDEEFEALWNGPSRPSSSRLRRSSRSSSRRDSSSMPSKKTKSARARRLAQDRRPRPLNNRTRRYTVDEVIDKLKHKQQQQMTASRDPSQAFIPVWKFNVVGNRGIGDEGMKYLRMLPTTITDIDLSDCSLTPVGIRLACEYVQHRESVHIRAKTQSESQTSPWPPSAITRCIMWGNKIGDDGANHVAEMLSSNSTLQELCIMQGDIGPFGYLDISRSLMFNRSLKELIVYHRKITELHVWAMQCFLGHNQCLESLDMWSAPPLSANLVSQLVDVVRQNSSIKRIKLGYAYPELSYYLTLNRCGRAATRKDDAADSDWMDCVMKSAATDNLDAIYYFLRNKPDLCDTVGRSPLKMKPRRHDDSLDSLLASSQHRSILASTSPSSSAAAPVVRGSCPSTTKRYLIQTYRALMAPVIPPTTVATTESSFPSAPTVAGRVGVVTRSAAAKLRRMSTEDVAAAADSGKVSDTDETDEERDSEGGVDIDNSSTDSSGCVRRRLLENYRTRCDI